jgi:hypothetical protein
MRTEARGLAPTQPGASNKLRSALDGLDENDLGTRMQKSSDFLRRGNFSDPLETGLTSDLQKLGQQIGEAARALGGSQRTSKDAELSRAMDDLSRVREQLAGLGGRSNSQPGQSQQPGQSGRAGQAGGQLSRNGQSPQAGQQQQSQSGQQQAQGGQAGQGGQTGDAGNGVAGPAGNRGGGGTNGGRSALSGYNGPISGRAGAPQPGPNPADTQREINQGLDLLNQVRAAVQDTPEARAELQALIDQMRNLDPKRFSANPAVVEQMHQQLVSQVDALELQLRRELEETRGGTIRNTDPTKVPAGYQDSVAEYYRELSGSNH